MNNIKEQAYKQPRASDRLHCFHLFMKALAFAEIW